MLSFLNGRPCGIQSCEKGSSLVEVLVAFFILAIGLLGVVGMQVSGMRSNQAAEAGTQVNLLARDMVDRIRAYDDVSTTSDDNDYDGISTDTVYVDPGCINSTGGCSGASLKQYDAFSWRELVTTSLPGGKGEVAWDNATSTYTITVMWDADKTGATGSGCSGDTSVDRTCFITELRL